MSTAELEILARAHGLFAGRPASPGLGVPEVTGAALRPGLPAAYLDSATRRATELVRSRGVDAELARIVTAARADHAAARQRTRAVLEAARADVATIPTNPVAHRELMRRRVARLRAQHGHLLTARRRARRGLAALLALRYGLSPGRITALQPNSRAAVAVRAALSRLGCPYVWGATGPDRFDCSGLVQWAYAHAGVRLDRTTYDQINDGVPVARAEVRPGDLVFPHPGHVQLAIGDDLVIEAPHAGADVRISRLGAHVAIRRPL